MHALFLSTSYQPSSSWLHFCLTLLCTLCSALIARATQPGYTLPRLAADFRAMCGMAMLLLWKRSQTAAQYVSNMLDAGNARLAAVPVDSQAVTPAQSPQPAAPAHAEAATHSGLADMKCRTC